MPKIQVGDVNLNYDVAGNGEPLLLIMGLGASRDGGRSPTRPR